MTSPNRALPIALLALSATLLPLTPCRAGPNPAPSGETEGGQPPVSVSFMTYNVQGPGWNPDRLAQVVSAIEAELPDVLSLHEAGSNGPNSAGVQLAAALSGDYDTFHTSTSEPVYLRKGASLNVLGMGIHNVPICPAVGGATQLPWMQLSTPEGALFDVYSAHFCVSFTPAGTGDPEGNQAQAASIANFIAGNTAPGSTYLLLGDLNANQTSLTIDYLVNGTPLTINGQPVTNPLDLDDTWGLAPGQGGQTHPGTTASGGQTALDWILAGPGVTVTAAEVITFVIPPGEADGFSDHLPVTATLDFALDNPWQDLGQGLAGTLGVPTLIGSGTLIGGDTITLSLSDALPSALSNLVLGFAAINAPFKGGTLVPDPLLLIGLSTDGAGQLELSGTWPMGIAPGATIFAQWWISDSGGPVGFAASNSVVGTTP